MRTRSLLALCGVAVLASVTVACGDDDDATEASAAPAVSDPAASAAGGTAAAERAVSYPLTVTHAYGDTTFPARPERIVTLGYGDEDPVAALGVTPVGVLDYDSGSLSPWLSAALGDAEADVTTIDTVDGIPYEQVTGLEPDAIFAMGNAVTDEEYELLSAIAPTVPYQTEAFLDPWPDVTRTIGEVLGDPAAADELIAGVDERIAATADEHPEWEGATFAVAVVFGPDEFGVLVSPEENTVRLMTDLGFELAPSVAALPLSDTGFSAFISPEELGVLDADVLILRAATAEEEGYLTDNPVFAALPAVGAGRVHWATNDEWLSLRVPSVLAVPYTLDQLVPTLEELVPAG